MYRISELFKLKQKIFHSQDLAVLWGMKNRNSLYTAIKRYVDKGVLIPVFKGVYATVPLSQIDPEVLGQALIHGYSYVSTETVLARGGVISQTVFPLTFVSAKNKKFQAAGVQVQSRQLKEDFLFETAGLEEKNGVLVASLERAVADMLYFQPKYHFDFPGKINFQKVKQIQKEVGYE